MVTLDPNHSDTEGSELLRQPQANLAHADNDYVSGSWHDPSADQRDASSGEQVLDYPCSKCSGEAHNQQRGYKAPDEVRRFVG
jgi:hypothetical protein